MLATRMGKSLLVYLGIVTLVRMSKHKLMPFRQVILKWAHGLREPEHELRESGYELYKDFTLFSTINERNADCYDDHDLGLKSSSINILRISVSSW